MKRTILITGSTDGIGKLVAKDFANEGHTVLLHGRNPEKLSATVSEIKTKSENDNVSGFVADFSDLLSVRQMVEEVKNSVTQIDVLINNAGIFPSPVEVTKDGFDIRFVVNYLAPYVLTEALIPLMQGSTDARIINLSSAAQAAVSLDALRGKLKLSVSEAYAQSKLALTMWSFRLAKQLENIAVIAVNPGSLLNTKMVKEAYGHHWSPADKGSNILYDLAVSDQHKGVTGKYFDNDSGGYANAHPDAYSPIAIDELISETEKIIK